MSLRIPPCLCLLLCLGAGLLKAETNWSAELLKEVLETRGRSTEEQGGAVAEKTSEEGLVLRTYQLRYLRVGDSVRGKNAVQLLTRMLPRGTTLKVDVPANSLHLLASASAQSATWDFLCSLDAPSENPQVGAQDLSPALQDVLQKLEAAQGGNKRLAEAVARIEEDLRNERKRQALEEERKRFWPYPLAAVGLVGGLVVWGFRRARRQGSGFALERTEQPSTLAPHELLGNHQQPSLQQRELQQEMLGAINAAAIRMEVWYNEQKAQKEQVGKAIAEQELALRQVHNAFVHTKEQLLSDNRALLVQAGNRFEASAEKLETNVQQLGRQQERVEALAGELQTTVAELDQTKDEMMRLQGLLEKRSTELELTRGRLNRREGELNHQQAKLAALTLLLEEGHWPERQEAPAQSGLEQPDNNTLQPGEELLQSEGSHAKRVPQALSSCEATIPQPQFQFLPPDYPET